MVNKRKTPEGVRKIGERRVSKPYETLFFQKATLTTLPVPIIFLWVQRFEEAPSAPPQNADARPSTSKRSSSPSPSCKGATAPRFTYARAPETLSNHPLPALSTLVYRIHTISEERWRRLLVWRAGLGVGDVGVVELSRAGAGGGRWGGCVSFCVAPTIFRTPSVCAGVFEKIV